MNDLSCGVGDFKSTNCKKKTSDIFLLAETLSLWWNKNLPSCKLFCRLCVSVVAMESNGVEI